MSHNPSFDISGLYITPSLPGPIHVVIEEQKSESAKINRLLSKASKKGTGKQGFPEFIIRFVDNPENIIVVECKSCITKHESPEKNKPVEYAVDGVLHYAGYLKGSFNVTAVAVSGENEKEQKISIYLWMKDAYTYSSIQAQFFLTTSEINETIAKYQNPITEDELVSKAIQYNADLHYYSIPEVERCTVVSAILVALQDDIFLKTYTIYTDNKELLKSLYDACERVLKKNKINAEKINVILSQYKKFEDNHSFTSPTIKPRKSKKEQPNTVFRDLIDLFHDEILPTIKSDHFDVLGKFYTQFIRYAGGDSKTGLVLTPSHITDFFCDIADLNENSIIFDPCCGTGGFLVSAMNYMINKAGINHDKIKEIKSKQLIGIEKRPDMFAHACSNMMMRGDGKSNIHHGSCFDNSLKEIVKSQKPTASFLNPPYQDGNAWEQLEFIENALECLEKNGICIAICQMSTVVSDDKPVTEVKKRLLQKHTLKATFSMPDELFYPVGVVTTVLVFEAHNPHSARKETFFGYFKNDGFYKRKNKGRVDCYSLWRGIREKWIYLYTNRKNIPGLSVTQKITSNDEWCAEAYMETDYKQLSDEIFIKSVKSYVAVQFLWNNLDYICLDRLNKAAVYLNIDQWKYFYLIDFFEMYTGKHYPKESFEKGPVNLISAKDTQNGVKDQTDLEPKFTTYGITIGKVSCSAFYQNKPFCMTTDATALINDEILNPYVGLFLSTVINCEKSKWSYGRQIRLNDSKKLRVKLPVKSLGEPDWEFMENYIKSLPYSSNL